MFVVYIVLQQKWHSKFRVWVGFVKDSVSDYNDYSLFVDCFVSNWVCNYIYLLLDFDVSF